MFCPECGNEISAEYNVCPNCGSIIKNNSEPDKPLNNEKMRKKDFYKKYESSTNKHIIALSIILLASAAHAYNQFFQHENYLAIGDVVVFLILGCVLWSTKKWWLVLLTTIFTLIGCIISYAYSGIPVGFIVVIYSAYLIKRTKIAGEHYDLYVRTGTINGNSN